MVPPLRYPPKYVAGIPYETPNAMDSGFQLFKLEKENRSDGGGQKFLYSKSESKILGESGVYGNKPEADCSTRNEKFHGRNRPGLVQVNQNVRAPEMPANGTENVQHNLGMDKTSYQVPAMEHKWQKVNRKPQDFSAKQVNHGGRDTANRKIKGNRVGLGRTNKKNYVKKEIKLQI